jgi:glycosyltransferase involved in cell wall biosynthesis
VFPDALFVLVGDGPEREKLETLTQQLGIQSSVVFVGQRDDIPGVYASFDIVALPSLTEAMPLAVLEALAAKRAVVASEVGDVPRMILHEQTGLLVQPGDDRGLADAIMRLLADGELRRKLGHNGHRFVLDHFSGARMARNYLGVYEDVMGEGKSRTKPLPERKIVDVLDR